MKKFSNSDCNNVGSHKENKSLFITSKEERESERRRKEERREGRRVKERRKREGKKKRKEGRNLCLGKFRKFHNKFETGSDDKSHDINM